MANPNGILLQSFQLEPPLDRAPGEMLRELDAIAVVAANGRRLRLPSSDGRSAGFALVLDGLRQARLAAYVEIDPANDTITQVLVPVTARVVEVRPQPSVYDVFVEPSEARHVLRRDHPDAAALEEHLTRARVSGDVVVLVEDDAHEIIDVIDMVEHPDSWPPLPPLPPPVPEPRVPTWWPIEALRRLFGTIRRWFCWCRWWWRCPSVVHAQQVFDSMAATTCNPSTVPAPCIPFLYPDDGCWARAHEMCRLMIAMGLSPRKVWIDATYPHRLHVATRNNPNCFVEWGWHVAPTLCVRGPRFWQTQRMVIDPSLFSTPVTQATWKGVQGDPAATLTDTTADQFWHGGGTDPNYVASNSILAQYRMKLLNRSLQVGPPPYANCP